MSDNSATGKQTTPSQTTSNEKTTQEKNDKRMKKETDDVSSGGNDSSYHFPDKPSIAPKFLENK
jgi:hypothetical protein